MSATVDGSPPGEMRMWRARTWSPVPCELFSLIWLTRRWTDGWSTAVDTTLSVRFLATTSYPRSVR